MNKRILTGALGALGVVGFMTWYESKSKWLVVKNLRHFKPAEWRGFWPYLDSRLLLSLERFRELLGSPVMISPADGALFRVKPGEASGNSQHFFGRAADVMIPAGIDAQTIETARAAGFVGIGLYPHWQPYPGLHLDVRTGPPATWAGINPLGHGQRYVSLKEGLSYVST